MPRNVKEPATLRSTDPPDCAHGPAADRTAHVLPNPDAEKGGSIDPSGDAHGAAWPETGDHAADPDTTGARCPLCQGRRLHYAFSSADRRVVRCAECRLVLLSLQPQGDETAAIAGASSAAGRDPGSEAATNAGTHGSKAHGNRQANEARSLLRQLARYRGDQPGAMLVVGAGGAALASEASADGFRVTRVHLPDACAGPFPCSAYRSAGTGHIIDDIASSVEMPASGVGAAREISCADLAAAGLAPASFDVCALTGALESASDPLALLDAARHLLAPRGVLVVATASLDSLCARGARDDPSGSTPRPDRLVYYDFNTIQTALHRAGFDQTIVRWSSRPDSRLAVDGLAGRVSSWVRQLLAQALWGDAPHPAGVLAMARAAGIPAFRALSVVVPAYNEAATVGPLLQALLRKRLPGLRIEVIVVESNSTDGTRDVVREFAAHPRLKLVLEDRPRGKGHAVRTGLAHATGDYVLIQDADLEYDLEDYDALLEPLVCGREALVLGSRHGGNAWWKMRRFAGQPLASFALNLGHWFFTTLLNLLFGQRLKDPFTMYKVFRRDCLFGLEFKCDRFDFDYELLVKMIRKGYQPIEIPVNYRSRSFKQGKKISALRDPLNWLQALAWLRCVRVDPLAEIERRRLADQSNIRSDPRSARPVSAPARAAA
jgi:SAM-dependent methyltransferase